MLANRVSTFIGLPHFAVFDIDAKSPFRIFGEQIDGAFTFDGSEFLLEVKWQEGKTPDSDLSVFSTKIGRKLDNTLGLFISMNGFQQSAIDLHSQGRPTMILMDGADLSAVLENRVGPPELLTRKRQHAAHTGEIFWSAYQILGWSQADRAISTSCIPYRGGSRPRGRPDGH